MPIAYIISDETHATALRLIQFERERLHAETTEDELRWLKLNVLNVFQGFHTRAFSTDALGDALAVICNTTIQEGWIQKVCTDLARRGVLRRHLGPRHSGKKFYELSL